MVKIENEVQQGPFARFLAQAVQNDVTHGRLLNTLSFMEHVGATKIARTQSGVQATFTTLKHAAEEARHAFYLKKLSRKLVGEAMPDYRPEFLFAPIESKQYLHRLDVYSSRLAGQLDLSGRERHDLVYLLVTFAIEVRADALYPVYEQFLEELPARISVQSIIAEEEGHLAEMEAALAKYPTHVQELKEDVIEFESGLFDAWLAQMNQELALMSPQALAETF